MKKNNVFIFENHQKVSEFVAKQIIEQIKLNQNEFVLGLPTGITPLIIYQLLIKNHEQTNLSWNKIKTFNLDEFVNLPINHKESFHYQMFTNLFNKLDLKEENINILDGNSNDLNNECKLFEAKIKQVNRIDLMLLTLGINGHIGYNEPGTDLNSISHVANLSSETIRFLISQNKFKTEDETPKQAITMGVKTIFDSKQILMVQTGLNKAKVAKEMLEGPITNLIPASKLQDHPNCLFLFDKEAASELDLLKHNVFFF